MRHCLLPAPCSRSRGRRKPRSGVNRLTRVGVCVVVVPRVVRSRPNAGAPTFMTIVLPVLLLSLLGAALFAALVVRSSHQAGRRSAWAVVAGLVAGVALVAAPGSASAAGDVVVTVKDAGGVVVEGALVTYDGPGAYVQQTDPAGETYWFGLDAGTVDFQVLGTWWDELGTGSVAVVDGSSAPLTITADSEPAGRCRDHGRGPCRPAARGPLGRLAERLRVLRRLRLRRGERVRLRTGQRDPDLLVR